MKKVQGIYSAPSSHWVGDGFPVRSLFSYNNHGKQLSPFLLLDYAGPEYFSSTDNVRGIGAHPHRGIETVTLVYNGEVAHKDSTGEGGVIGAGDVQWMTAGSGILHEEYHSPAFTKSGGLLRMVQLWVNLPAKDKMTPAKYQSIEQQQIPQLALDDNGSYLRVIAGRYADLLGPAYTFSPLQLMDFHLKAASLYQFKVNSNWNTALVVLQGTVLVNGNNLVTESQLALLDPEGQDISLEATSDAIVLLLSGEDLNEPVAGRGPFVMNTQEQLEQAFRDFRNGQFEQHH